MKYFRAFLRPFRFLARELWRNRYPLLAGLVVTENVVPALFGPIYCLGLFPARHYTAEKMSTIWTNTAEAYSVVLYVFLGNWAWRGLRSGGRLFLSAQNVRQIVSASLQ